MVHGDPLQALVHDWVLVEGEFADPVVGQVIRGLGLLLDPDSGGVDRRRTHVSGQVVWARCDSANCLLETVIEMPTWRVLTRLPASEATPVPSLGTQTKVSGYLTGIGSYEAKAFDLVDVSQEWLVLSLAATPRGDLVLDLEPVAFRFNV